MVLILAFGTSAARAFVNVSVAPTNQVVFIGSNAVFNAQATPTAGEIITGYDWQTSTNGLSPFTTIPGATNATLTLTNSQLTNTAYYFARAIYSSGGTNGFVSVSPLVTLIVVDQARITSQPQSLIRSTGTNASFSVSALGSPPLGFQWRRNGVSLAEGGRISGSTTTNLVISNLALSDTGSYTVIVTNTYTAATSTVATLNVFAPPVITVQPPDVAVVIGSNATLSVTATGSVPLAYQWMYAGTNITNGGRFSGATTNKLLIAATVTNDTGLYSVTISNIVGMVTSSNAFLTILVPPVITSGTNALGQQGFFFSFTNTATGSIPLAFDVQGLPSGLTNDPTTGIISGIPDVFGDYILTVVASNAASTATGQIALTLITDVPGITSPLLANGKQGQAFSYTITASNNPTSFSTSPLPAGLNFDPTNGVISGAPLVNGSYNLIIGATNQYGGDSQLLTLSIASSVPIITSPLLAGGKQGLAFNYTITGSDNPNVFSTTALPTGINFDPTTGLISGAPIVNGSFAITIGATNQFGGDSKSLTLVITSSVPHFTGSLTVTGTENTGGFTYAIQASDSPTSYGASGLPFGLTLNTATGVITGAPMYGGPFNIPISAVNAWGTGTTNLTLKINYANVAGLSIVDVITNWSSPYLLDFTFSLRDNADPALGTSIVRPLDQLQVLCLEQATNPIPSEAPFILQSASKKQLKMFLALDYTYSMFAVDGAIDAMQDAAKLLIDSEPAHSLFGLIEFNADYMDPQFVTNALTTTSNYFIADKTVLAQSIDGIQDTYVQGNYAGTRCFDAIDAALRQFDTNNVPDEQRYVVVMSDGNDDSSLVNTNPAALSDLAGLAVTNHVRIFCVAFGQNINSNALQFLTSTTSGHYYVAATTADLALQFSLIAKDIDGRYSLRWATLRRAPVPFQPAFQVTVSNITASWNTDIVSLDILSTNTNSIPPIITTNTTNVIVFPYNPANYTGDVRIGSLRLVPDSDLGPQTIRLRATYVPRAVRQLQLKYRPNYPCTAILDSNGTNEILAGWSLAETADSNGLRTLTLTSPQPTNLLASIPYAAFGDLVSFQFAYPESLTATQAFSVFTNDNSIYTNIQPAGIKFLLQNGTNFVTSYPPAPPHGTPIPWLLAHGFTTNFATAELADPNGNGLMVWQDYLAGLNPTDPNSRFDVEHLIVPGQPPELIFNTVAGRTYRVDTATDLGSWTVLLDNIPGSGGAILFTDLRNLSGVSSVFYRVSVR